MVVSVNRSVNQVNGANYGLYSWSVQFDSVPGNLPLIVAYPGRLTASDAGQVAPVTMTCSGRKLFCVFMKSSCCVSV